MSPAKTDQLIYFRWTDKQTGDREVISEYQHVYAVETASATPVNNFFYFYKLQKISNIITL